MSRMHTIYNVVDGATKVLPFTADEEIQADADAAASLIVRTEIELAQKKSAALGALAEAELGRSMDDLTPAVKEYWDAKGR